MSREKAFAPGGLGGGLLFFSERINAPGVLQESRFVPLHAALGARGRAHAVEELAIELLPSQGVGLAERALLDGGRGALG